MKKSSAPYRGKKALIVDDDRVVRLLLTRMMASLGFEVTEAADGREALETASRLKFDLVITDLSMPHMNGIQFVREALAAGLAAPVIFLSATDSEAKVMEARSVGAFEFLEKPMNAYRLAEVVRDAMAGPGAGAAPPSGEHEPADLSMDIDVDEAEAPQEDARTAGAAPAQAKLPKRTGRYEVQELIARGGMSVVYKCKDPLLGRPVAVKVFHPAADGAGNAQDMVSRFQREAGAAAALAHPNIVAIHDMGLDEGSGDWFIVMELLQGRGLHGLLDEKEKIPEKEVLSLGFQLADALAFAHARGVAHRDVKPSNVMIRQDGFAKLLDFGMASVRGWSLTLSGQILGAPSCMAPERIRGEPGGPLSDQFSLGVVLYHALTGENPFDGDTMEARFMRVLEHDPPPVAEVAGPVAPELSATIARLMSKDDQGRFPTMGNAADALLMLGRSMDLGLRRYIAMSGT
ncbi:MAG: response regulator [Pseudomonadota bacterium]